jgi:hypothetical protein
VSNLKTKAIVIDNKPDAPNKNRVVLFTETFGKISVMLTGYGKSANHWAGVFEGGNIIEISVVDRKNRHIISGWKRLFLSPERTFEDFLLRAMLLEATAEVIPFNETNVNLFKWLEWALKNPGISSVCIYFSRLIYSGGFFDFSNRLLLPTLKKNFRDFLRSKTKREIFSLIKQQVGIIESFTGKRIKSFEIFSESLKKEKAVF